MGDLTPNRKSVDNASTNLKLRKLELQKEVLRVEKMRLEVTILELQDQVERHYATMDGIDRQVEDIESELAKPKELTG